MHSTETLTVLFYGDGEVIQSTSPPTAGSALHLSSLRYKPRHSSRFPPITTVSLSNPFQCFNILKTGKFFLLPLVRLTFTCFPAIQTLYHLPYNFCPTDNTRVITRKPAIPKIYNSLQSPDGIKEQAENKKTPQDRPL